MFKSLLLILTISFFTPVNVYAHDKLIFAIDIIRHGDRTPVSPLPKANHHWPEGPGQLTAVGMSQEYQLGHKLREKYVTQYHLLPEHYSQETMYVRSTAYDRTLMSAQSLLLGLYPLGTGPVNPRIQTAALPQGYQPIPIFSVPRQHDSLLRVDNNKVRFKKLLQRYVFSTPEWQTEYNGLKPHFKAWSAATGIDIKSPQDLIHIADALYIDQLYKVPLPPQLSKKDEEIIRQSARALVLTIYKNQSLATIANSQLLKRIAITFQKASKHPTPLKYILFSAHDSTVAAQMAIIGNPVDKPPKYASDLNFSLFEQGHDHYYVTITYNDQPQSIPFCGGYTCTLEQFSQLAKEKDRAARKLLGKSGT